MTPEQIQNWRRVISLMLTAKAQQLGLSEPHMAGMYAMIMPEDEIIALRDKLQADINSHSEPVPEKRIIHRKKRVCDHSNSIVGSKGRYCIDCEMYT